MNSLSTSTSTPKPQNDTLFIYKYKPTLFHEFEIDPDLILLLRTLISMNNLNILFVGDTGSGKTTMIDALIKEYYLYNSVGANSSVNKGTDRNSSVAPSYSDNIMYINSLKEQGINFYRNEVKTFCQTCSSIKGKKKIVVLDDIDLINEQSQQVFRNCIDKYSNNVHFISSCNNTQKVIESIQSRLIISKIKPFTHTHLSNIMHKIAIREQIEMHPDAQAFTLSICNNAAKILINYMEKFKLLNQPITLELATNVCTNISFCVFEELTQHFKRHNLESAITILYNIYDKGYSVMDILDTYSLFIKSSTTLEENDKYVIISFICKYITIFHNIHEEPVELALFANNLIQHI